MSSGKCCSGLYTFFQSSSILSNWCCLGLRRALYCFGANLRMSSGLVCKVGTEFSSVVTSLSMTILLYSRSNIEESILDWLVTVSSALFKSFSLIAASLACKAVILICFLISRRKGRQIFGHVSMLEVSIGGISMSNSVLIESIELLKLSNSALIKESVG